MTTTPSKVYLVTGANAGIGLEATRQLVARADTKVVYMLCRSKERAQAAIDESLGNPSNVKFIDLGSTDNMIDLMVSRMLNQKPEETWAIPKTRLVGLVARHLESKSYSTM